MTLNLNKAERLKTRTVAKTKRERSIKLFPF